MTDRSSLCLITLVATLHSGCFGVDARYARLQKRLHCGIDRSTAISVVSDMGLIGCRPEAYLPGNLQDNRVPADALCGDGKDFVALWFGESGTLAQYEFGSYESSEPNRTGTNFPPVKCSPLPIKQRS